MVLQGEVAVVVSVVVPDSERAVFLSFGISLLVLKAIASLE